jgi:excisionase family DNA binding protein
VSQLPQEARCPVSEDEATAIFAHHGDKLLYRVPEAARLLALGPSKMWELIARGEISSVKIDGSRRISRDAIEAYVARLAGGGDGPAA